MASDSLKKIAEKYGVKSTAPTANSPLEKIAEKYGAKGTQYQGTVYNNATNTSSTPTFTPVVENKLLVQAQSLVNGMKNGTVQKQTISTPKVDYNKAGMSNLSVMGSQMADNPRAQAEKLYPLLQQGGAVSPNKISRSDSGLNAEKVLQYSLMTDDEKRKYDEYYAYSPELAEKYFEEVQLNTDLNQRAAQRIYGNLNTTLDKAAYTYASGFTEGLRNIGDAKSWMDNDNTKKADSVNAITQSMVQQGAMKDGKRTAESALYDILASTGNMTPGMVVSAMTGAPLVGSAVFALEQGGAKYREAINEGYSIDKANLAAVRGAGDEEATNLLLGGIGAFGGGLIGKALSNTSTGKAVSKAVSNMFKTEKGKILAKAFLDYAGKMGSEGVQEFVQYFTEGFGDKIILGKDFDVNMNDAWYSALVGALNAGMLNVAQPLAYVPSMTAKADFSDASMDMAKENFANEDVMNAAQSLKNVTEEMKAKNDAGKRVGATDKLAQAIARDTYREAEVEAWNNGEISENDLQDNIDRYKVAFGEEGAKAYEAFAKETKDVRGEYRKFAEAYNNALNGEDFDGYTEEQKATILNSAKADLATDEKGIREKASRLTESLKRARTAGNANRTKIDYDSFDASTKADIDTIEGFVTQKLHANIEWFTSQVNEKGEFVDENGKSAENGSYSPSTNTFRLDTNAGANKAGDSTKLVNVLSHETTHWLEQYSPEAYLDLQNAVRRAYGYAWMTKVNDEITAIKTLEERKKASDPDYEMREVTREEAISEIVARTSEDMLQNSAEAKKLINSLSPRTKSSLRQHLEELKQDVKEYFDELLGRTSSNSEEAQIIRAEKEQFDKVLEAWDNALKEGVEGLPKRTAKAKTEAKADTKVEESKTEEETIKKEEKSPNEEEKSANEEKKSAVEEEKTEEKAKPLEKGKKKTEANVETKAEEKDEPKNLKKAGRATDAKIISSAKRILKITPVTEWKAPFTYGGKTYIATNNMVVRLNRSVEGLGATTANDVQKNAIELFDRFFGKENTKKASNVATATEVRAGVKTLNNENKTLQLNGSMMLERIKTGDTLVDFGKNNPAINAKYYEDVMQILPDADIYISKEKEAVYFKGADGDAIIMPVNRAGLERWEGSDFVPVTDIKFGEKEVSSNEIITDGATVTAEDGKQYSIRSMQSDIAEGQMFDDLVSKGIMTKEEAGKLKENLNKLVGRMILDRGILDMNEDYGREGRRFSPYKPNSDPLYKISMDFSTLCSKRLTTQYVIERLQVEQRRPMSADEQMAIRDMLIEYRKQEKALQVACAMCYVEAARLKSPKQIQKWLDDPATQMRNYFADKNKEFDAKIKEAQADFKESKGVARNATKDDLKKEAGAKAVAELNKIRPAMRESYSPTAEEQKVIDLAKSLDKTEYLTAENLAKLRENPETRTIYEAYSSFIRTATRSKALETDEAYYYGDSTRDNGNGIVVTDQFIEDVNKENGMRFSSWSDWRIQHMLDYITAVIDLSVRGSAMHGYTKFPDEVRVLGKTGMMFNLSGVLQGGTGVKDGKLDFSPTESIDYNEALKLREEFPETAGFQCIGVSNESIRLLLQSDYIDYVIPYHTSGLNAELIRMAGIYGWKDYTGVQNASIDKNISIDDEGVDTAHWHEEPVYSEFFVGYDTGMTGIEAMKASADNYVRMCKERGLTPKFNDFVNEECYWKLLIDRKMINQQTGELIQQKPVKPEFDFSDDGAIYSIINKYVEDYPKNKGMEDRALNYVRENFDALPERIKKLKKANKDRQKKMKEAQKKLDEVLATLQNETLAATPKAETERVQHSTRQTDKAYEKAVNDGDTRYSTRDSLNDRQKKNFDYNESKTETGDTLKTLNGSPIKRSRYGVGKEIGGQVYFHKNYADDVIPAEQLSKAEELLKENYPDFKYNCMMYDPKKNTIRFDSSPDFDTAREPVTGEYVTTNIADGTAKKSDGRFEKYIWHHKWLWVKDDYKGFDVSESWEWSKKWLNTITETSDGNGIGRWNAQLDRFNLPKDTSNVQYSLRNVEPVTPVSNKWQSGHSEKWFTENGFPVREDVATEWLEARKNKGWVEGKKPLNEKGFSGTSKKVGTQISSTEKTYGKIYDALEALPDGGKGMRMLDASSGLGLGTKLGLERGLDVEDIEPYVHPDSDYFPDYMDYSSLQDHVENGDVKPYDFIISNAVLNVIPQDTRDNMVKWFDSVLADGGMLYVNTLDANYTKGATEEKTYDKKGNLVGQTLTQKGENGAGNEVFVGSSQSVQKGFSNSELRDYLQDALGDGYTVVNSEYLRSHKLELQNLLGERYGALSQALRAGSGAVSIALKNGDASYSTRMSDEEQSIRKDLAEKHSYLYSNSAHKSEWTTKRVGDKKEAMTARDILAKMEHDFGVNVTEGYVNKPGVRGYYNTNTNGIRLKMAREIPVACHELGHRLDLEYGVIKKLSSKEEADLMKSYHKSFTDDQYKPNERLGEGFAEYLRQFMQNSEDARNEYPDFTDKFLKSLSPETYARVTNLADEINAFYVQGSDTASSSIVNREDSVMDFRTPAEKISDMGKEFNQAWVDSNSRIKDFQKAFGGMAYTKATNAAYSDSVAGQIIYNDLTDINGNYVGPGLRRALEGVNTRDKTEYKDFNEYLVCKHGIERLEYKKDVFANPVQNDQTWMMHRMVELEDKYPAFKEASEKLYQYEKNLVETWAVDTGIISQRTVDIWNEKYKHHVPLYRATEKGGSKGAKRSYANQGNPFFLAKGGTKEIINPVDNIIDETVKLVNISKRNAVMQELRDTAINAGDTAGFMELVSKTKVKETNIKPLKETLKLRTGRALKGRATDEAIADVTDILDNVDDVLKQYQKGNADASKNEVTVLVNGEKEIWKINDPALYESITTMAPATRSGFLNAYGATTRFMTQFITGKNVIWSIFSNAPRDLGTFITYSKDRNIFNELESLASTYKNSYLEMRGKTVDPLYAEYLAMGGGNVTAYSAEIDLAKKARREFSMTKGQKIGNDILNLIPNISNTIERGPRYATYAMLRNNGVDAQTAFYEAMDVTTNFRKAGVKSRETNKIIPFFNAGVQGADKLVRFFSADDVNSSVRGKVAVSRVAAATAVSATLAVMLYGLNNSDDDKKKNYQRLSNYTKNTYFLFPKGDGTFFAVPKPRELGFAVSFFERLLERTNGKNKQAFFEFEPYVVDNFLPSVASDIASLPSEIKNNGLGQGGMNVMTSAIGSLGIFGVLASTVANKDFLGRNIVSEALSDYKRPEQYTDTTSKLAVAIGKALGLSPQRIDYVANQTIPAYWKPMKALFPMSGKKIDKTLGVHNTYNKDPLYSTDLVNRLYDKKNKSNEQSAYKTMEESFEGKMDSMMTSFYNNFYKLSKNEEETPELRNARGAVLDRIDDYLTEWDEGSDLLEKLKNVVVDTGDTSIAPSALDTEVKGDNGTYDLTYEQYYNAQMAYNTSYWDSVDKMPDNLSEEEKVTYLGNAKNLASYIAKNEALKDYDDKLTNKKYDSLGSALDIDAVNSLDKLNDVDGVKKDGKTVSGSKKKAQLNEMNGDFDLYKAMYPDDLDDTYRAFKSAGGSDREFMKHTEAFLGMSGEDKQEDVIDYIKKQTSDVSMQKALFEMAGYKCDSTKDGEVTTDGNFNKKFGYDEKTGPKALAAPGKKSENKASTGLTKPTLSKPGAKMLAAPGK